MHLLVIFATVVASVYSYTFTDKIRLTQFKTKYQNGVADIIFLMDTSGSVYDWRTGRNGFIDEKKFVDSLLNEIKVSKMTSRVTIIRFGSYASIDINYISNPRPEHQKCQFHESFKGVTFRSGMTNMYDGFNKAKQVLYAKLTRPWRKTDQTLNVKKTVILLSDGGWNEGPSPQTLIDDLKRDEIELFTVGVADADRGFLKNAASRNDNYFYFSDFIDLGKLASDIRGDPNEADYDMDAVSRNLCKLTCDSNAICGCGLKNGRYLCLCNPGFYGSGSPGECFECPNGKYKEKTGYAKQCTSCPGNSGHNKKASITRDDCQCNKGYEGNPKNGAACTIKTCRELKSPEFGYTNPTDCKLTYGSECLFKCNDGYKLLGAELVKCDVTGQSSVADWEPKSVTQQCIRKRCPEIEVENAVVKKGNCTYDDLRVDAKCKFQCKPGHRMTGKAELTCNSDETWSSEAPTCEVVKCKALNAISFTKINKRECVEQDMVFSSACTFTCAGGYRFQINGRYTESMTRVCRENGEWDGANSECVDIEAPVFTDCPTSKTYRSNTSPELPTAEITWPVPTYTDNSMIVDQNHNVKLTFNYAPPHKFKTGKHTISYTVTDKAKKSAYCDFYVVVEDKEPPRFTSCPSDHVETTSKTTVLVVWNQPVAIDNSGIKPHLSSNEQNSKEWSPSPVPKKVVYTARDDSGNINKSCVFHVFIKEKTCPLSPPPANGLVLYVRNDKLARIMCKRGFDFGKVPPRFYFCEDAMWKSFDTFSEEKFTDCSVTNVPANATLKMENSFYFSGDCKDEAFQLDLKKKFYEESIDQSSDLSFFCTSCEVKNIKIFCGETTSVGKRRKRAASEVYLSADYVMTKDNVRTQDEFKKLKSDLEKIKAKVQGAFKKMFDNRKLGLTPVKDPSLKSAQAFCFNKRGTIVGRCSDSSYQRCESGLSRYKDNRGCLCNGEVGSREMCIECPIGKYYHIQNETCVLCSPGTYQDEEGQIGCKQCQPGFATEGNDEKNFTACKEICKAGYYSSTGLSPCFACPQGKYSNSLRSTSCQTCPKGTTTVLAASVRIEECGMKCAPGTYSNNGVEPCLPCPKGSYSEKEGSLTCLPCPAKKSTYGPGAAILSKCVDIVNCASNPCNNQAKCIELKDNYECECRSGFEGRNCEDVISYCKSHPCYKNAVCVDKVNDYECVCPSGYTGKNCDILFQPCAQNECQNGGNCVVSTDKYICECADGYTGQYCEVKIDNCRNKPCKNNGLCKDGVKTFTCACLPGFKGSQCETEVDECASDPCKNGGTCVDKVAFYVCKCAVGFSGRNCEIRLSDSVCAPNPCKNRGLCQSTQNSFECICPTTFTGRLCETEQSNDFDLVFPTYNVRSFSKVTMRQNLHAFTIAFWMRSRDESNPGTPISYAVKSGNYIQDNAIVLKDYGNLVLQINDQTEFINDQLVDGKWHHVALTWQSSDGIWVYYKDGKEYKRASQPVAKGDYVRGGGDLVITQEQDWDSTLKTFTYNPLEAFIGQLSQVFLWKISLSAREVYNLAGRCNTAEQDDLVVSWADFLPNVEGVYKKIDNSAACHFTSALRSFEVSLNSYIPSNDNKVLRQSSPEACAKYCLENQPLCRSFDYHRSSSTCYLSVQYQETVATAKNNDYDYYEISCRDSLGMESGAIPDARLSSSSQLNGNSGPTHSRINRIKNSRSNIGVPISEGGWIPKYSRSGEYLTIDLGSNTKVTAIETQGADQTSNWVTQYTVHSKTNNGNSWTTSHTGLKGNTNSDGKVKNQVNIVARYIKIVPTAWHQRIALRLELYGCATGAQGVPTDEAVIAQSHSTRCSSSTCKNNGRCISLSYGFACKCPNGFTGKTCEIAPRCTDDPGVPLFGSRISYTAGVQAMFRCNSGYQLSGSSTRRCVTGKWSGSPVTCTNINECSQNICNQHCEDFPGSYRCYCSPGYKLKSDMRTCEDVNECTEGRCSHNCVNKPGSFACSCPSGMKLDASGTRCQDIDECKLPNHGCQHICKNLLKTYKCQCNPGYVIDSSDQKSCLVIKCPQIQTPRNGKVITTGQPTLGNSATFECNDGYKLVGSDERSCAANRLWTGVQTTCEPVSCIEIGTVDQATRSSSSRSYNTRVTFTCARNYRLQGSASRTCLKTSVWSGTQPFCVASLCPVLKAPTNGRINGFRTDLGSTVGVECDEGYAVTGTSFRTCQASGVWTGSDPTCNFVNCGDPGVPSNGYKHGNHYIYNNTISFSCKSRHHLEGERVIKCLASGKWSAPTPECLARSCGNPGVPRNGYKIGTKYLYGSTVEYACQIGYNLVGNKKRHCEEATAAWTGTLPLCNLVTCSAQRAPSNGYMVGTEFTYLKKVSFDCNIGYKLVGSYHRTCQLNGQWSGTMPTCVKTSCGKVLTVSGDQQGVIETPNYPNFYDNDIYCTWKITADVGKKINLQFADFKTEQDKDIVYIYDTDSVNPILQMSGVQTKYLPVTSSGNSIRIRFISNSATATNGFQIRYSQTSCGGMFYSNYGEIKSPGYKGQYPDNLDCSWLISMPGKRIGVQFKHFDTEEEYDFLWLYRKEERDSQVKLYFKPSGNRLIASMFKSYYVMYLRFTSDAPSKAVHPPRNNGFHLVFKETY